MPANIWRCLKGKRRSRRAGKEPAGDQTFVRDSRRPGNPTCLPVDSDYTKDMQAAGLRQSWGSAAEVILAPASQLALYGEAVVWFHKVELFRREEENRMYRQSPTPQDMALHKELLLRLVGEGEHLSQLIEQHGLLPNVEGVTKEDA
jgi:hypothetical protein